VIEMLWDDVPVEAKAMRPLLCPAEGKLGVVFSYIQKPDGSVNLRVSEGPDGPLGAECEPGWIEVVGYYRNLTPAVIAGLIEHA
jgi:hypothetical protein